MKNYSLHGKEIPAVEGGHTGHNLSNWHRPEHKIRYNLAQFIDHPKFDFILV